MSKAPVTVLPKPCLKQALAAEFCSQKKHAHFPPPSQEAQRYSGIEYDRTPIIVDANELALPARGCPGRTFDDVDAHHYRHRHKKHPDDHSKPSSHRNSDEVHPNYYTNAAAASTWPMDLSQSQYIMGARSTVLSSLSTIPGDTSESDGDMSPPMSESDGQQQPFLPGSVSMARGHQPRRLRKAGTADRHRASGRRTTELSPTSTFASCPGSNSCLGGF